MESKKTDTAPESPVTGANEATGIQVPTGQESPAEGTPGGARGNSQEEGQELYTASDFVAAAEKLFPDKKSRPSKYIIVAAFRFNGVEQATKEDGIRMIRAFMERKVE